MFRSRDLWKVNSKDHAVAALRSGVHAGDDHSDRATPLSGTQLQEACRFLRIPEGTLRYWRHLGCGPRSFKVGRHVRYWRTDVVLWLAEQTNRPRNGR